MAGVLRNPATLTLVMLALITSQPERSLARNSKGLSFAERVAYQRAIEEVYWRHRIWPKENPGPKPPLDAVVSPEKVEKKVTDHLRKSQALADYWRQPITAEQLQAEMDRMASHTKQPDVLCELFAALGNDPFVVAECLARPVLAERFVRELNGRDGPLGRPTASARPAVAPYHTDHAYKLPEIPDACADDTWMTTAIQGEGRYRHTAVWTGSEMIVWGGEVGLNVFSNTGERYNPSTDSWGATSTVNAPRPGRISAQCGQALKWSFGADMFQAPTSIRAEDTTRPAMVGLLRAQPMRPRPAKD